MLKLFHVTDQDVYAADTKEEAIALGERDSGEKNDYPEDVIELTDAEVDAEFDESDDDEQLTGNKTCLRAHLNETTEKGWFAGSIY